MANSRLSFVIAIRLLADNFNKGANRIKSQLLSMQRSFLALASAAGAGAIGLTNFISKAIETAKATTQASVALKNVSGTTAAFVENQKWLVEVAKKYGVEINTLTTGFAKFKAAADISNMSLDSQRKIFESVARASVAFGLSAEDQKGVFMALSQMMSKNKVMAEELRLQLAERMPVAIQAMAKAAGVTVGELDNLMKQGKVLSADVLPKFADALNEMIANPDTNNLNKSLVDLSNAFTNLVKNLDITGIFKDIVDKASGLLTTLSDKATAVAGVVKTAFVGMLAKGLTNTWGDAVAEYDKAVAAAVKAVKGGQRAIERVEKAELAYKKAQTTLYEAEVAKKVVSTTATAEEIKQIDRNLNNARTLLKQKETELYKATEAQKTAATKATAEQIELAAQANATGWVKAGNVIVHSIKMIGSALKAAFMANIWTMVTTGIIKLGQLVVEMDRAYKAYKKLGDYDATAEMHNLSSYADLLNHKDESVREGALQQINGILGERLSWEDDINSAIEKRLKLLALEARLKQAQQVREEQLSRTQGWWNKLFYHQDIAKKRAEEASKEIAAVTAEIDVLKKDTPTPTKTATTGGGGKPIKVGTVELDLDWDLVEPDLEDKLNKIISDTQAKIAADAAAMQKQNKQAEGASALDTLLSTKRNTSEDWKLSPTEIMEADRAFIEARMEAMIRLYEQYGVELGDALSTAIKESTNLKDAIRATEIKDTLDSLNKEMGNLAWDGISGMVGDIDGVVNAFQRLDEAMEEDATTWERIMAVWGVFSTAAQGVISIMETIARAKEISAQIEAATAAQTVAASTGEAAATVGSKVAKETPGWAALVAVPAAIGAILAAFSAIPKFAKGGIVGGNSTQGDKVLARLNSGEGVLTAEGLESLHDAANPRNARKVTVTGVLTGRGRDLMAVIDTETKYRTRTK